LFTRMLEKGGEKGREIRGVDGLSAPGSALGARRGTLRSVGALQGQKMGNGENGNFAGNLGPPLRFSTHDAGPPVEFARCFGAGQALGGGDIVPRKRRGEKQGHTVGTRLKGARRLTADGARLRDTIRCQGKGRWKRGVSSRGWSRGRGCTGGVPRGRLCGCVCPRRGGGEVVGCVVWWGSSGRWGQGG